MGKTAATNPCTARELVLFYLRTQVEEKRAREPGARIDSPDAVHRMRVASRRLRSSLATFAPLFSGSQGQQLRDELLWLGAVLGPVRDAEVMMDHLRGTAAILALDAELSNALTEMDRELEERHSLAHDDLIMALNSRRCAMLLDALTEFVTDPPWIAKARSGIPCPRWWGERVPASIARP